MFGRFMRVDFTPTADAPDYVLFQPPDRRLSIVRNHPWTLHSKRYAAWYMPCNLLNLRWLLSNFRADMDGETIDRIEAIIYDCKLGMDYARSLIENIEHIPIEQSGVDTWEILNYTWHSPFKPMRHQALQFLLGMYFKQWGIFLGTGTGKTVVALNLIIAHGAEKALIVAPLSIVPEWIAEAGKHTPFLELQTTPLENAARRVEEDITRINTSAIYVTAPSRLISKKREHVYLKQPWDMMIVDESTRIKNPAGKQTRSAIRIGRKIEYKYILSGTPWGDKPIDIFSQILFLTPRVFGRNFSKFKERYVVYGGLKIHDRPVMIVGYKNMDELREMVANVSLYIPPDECLDLPERIYLTRYYEMSDVQRARYDAAAEDLILYINDNMYTIASALTRVLRLSQITAGFISASNNEENIEEVFEEQPKLDRLVEIVEDLQAERPRKIIVWTRFLRELHAAYERMEKFGAVEVWGMCGDVDGRLNAFKHDDGCRVLVCQLKVGSEGLNLGMADTAIYLSNSYSAHTRQQSEGRIRRAGAGNKHPRLYIDLVADKTVDVAILKVLKNKYETIETLLNKNSITNMVYGG